MIHTQGSLLLGGVKQRFQEYINEGCICTERCLPSGRRIEQSVHFDLKFTNPKGDRGHQVFLATTLRRAKAAANNTSRYLMPADIWVRGW